MPTIAELKEIAKGRGLTGYSKMKKEALLQLVGEQVDANNQVIINGPSDVVNVFTHNEPSFHYKKQDFKQVPLSASFKLYANDKGDMMMIQKFAVQGKGLGKAGAKSKFEFYQVKKL